MISSRIARPEDCRAVFDLANEALVRAVSFSTEPIAFESHVSWYTSRLEDPNCILVLFFDGDALVAQVRFIREPGGDQAEVSISVAEAYRGKGAALPIMHEALEYPARTWGIAKVMALVKVENEASNKYFKRAGYAFSRLTNYKGYDCNVYFFKY
jgi:RimJ/RimL family protein N-acetyltransferase